MRDLPDILHHETSHFLEADGGHKFVAVLDRAQTMTHATTDRFILMFCVSRLELDVCIRVDVRDVFASLCPQKPPHGGAESSSGMCGNCFANFSETLAQQVLVLATITP